MPHFRQDVLTGRWVIFAPDRTLRPNDFPLERPRQAPADDCPFCPGREDRTTPEVAAVGRPAHLAADGPGWRLRCFPNLYPALTDRPSEPGTDSSGLFPVAPAVGFHEVIVCAPDHDARLEDLESGHAADLVLLVRDRIADLSRRLPGHHVLPFMNMGPEAGATLGHSHLQIMAVPMVPPTVTEAARCQAEHRANSGSCLVCAMLEDEAKDGRRIVELTEHWIALAPWASRFPWEVGIWPRRHQGDLTACGEAECGDLAGLLQRILRSQRRRHGEHSYNLVLLGGPPPAEGLDSGARSADNDYHWHLTLTPRLVRLAGFETGSGFFINPVLPERAAGELRLEGTGI